MDFFPGLLKTLSSLAVVLALVVLASAIARRWVLPKLVPDGAQQPLRLVHSLSLGGRRNIMVVEVGRRTLVVGATAQHVTLLTEFEKEGAATAAPAPSLALADGRAGAYPAPPEEAGELVGRAAR